MRIAFYNIENLFFRHRDLGTDASARIKNGWITELDDLIRQHGRSPHEISRIRQLSRILGFESKDPFRVGRLLEEGCSLHYHNGMKGSGKAGFENSWKGWIDIVNYPLSTNSVSFKARCIAEGNADLLLLQQVEDRESLDLFNRKVLSDLPFVNYSTNVVFAGNDFRKIEQGILLRNNLLLEKNLVNRYHRVEPGTYLFERDFNVFQVGLPGEKKLWIIMAELATQRMDKHASDERRLKQSKEVAKIYRELRQQGVGDIIVAGSFYALPYCYSIAPIFNCGLKEITRHPGFHFEEDLGVGTDYHSLGGYKKGLNLKQYDYMFLSPELWHRVKDCGLIRKGVWAGKPNTWPVYRNLKSLSDQASSHPLLWIDISI